VRSAARARSRAAEPVNANVTAAADITQTPLAGKVRRHELGYKNMLDTLRIALANLEADLAMKLAFHLDRPREVKKVLATLSSPRWGQSASRHVP
jgi:hypothetical protein